MTEEWSSTNQQKTEPVPPTPAHSGDGVGVPDGASVPDGPAGSDAQGVPVPSEVPAEGTSEGAVPVDGVRVTAIAQEGLADGETDVRMPPTTTF
ncbi:MAG TPA: hypothetical protein VF519_17550 [Mycobacteriales bacterium]|jgi:hypothetical protein